MSDTPLNLRLRYRLHVGDAIRQIVLDGSTLVQAIEGIKIPEVDAVAFTNFLDYELQHLATCNCARYRLPMGKTQEWIDNGRRR